MKKIAYIELDTHAEIAANFLELMQDSKAVKVDFYLAKKVLSQLNLLDNENIYRSSSTEILHQLSIVDYDLLILGTVHRNFNIYLKIAETYKTAVICHNLNFCNIPKWTLFQNIFKKDFKYRLKLLLKEGLLSAPIVFEKASHLFVLDEGLLQNKFKFLPLFYSKLLQVKHKKSEKIIVIPGNVSQERRDYSKILKIISELKTNSKLQFVFLGKAKGIELNLIKVFQSKLPENISLKYFTEKVSQEEFDENMIASNVLWCPIQKNTEFLSQTEIYGKTKMSGNIGDAIKYGKAAIFPKHYKTVKPFIIDEKDDFEAQISNFNSEDQLNFQENFNKDKVRIDLENVLKSLL